jgi:hypothetical protein
MAKKKEGFFGGLLGEAIEAKKSRKRSIDDQIAAGEGKKVTKKKAVALKKKKRQK